MSLNKAMLIGNVGKDPEVRYLESNNAKVARFTLATTERYRDRNGELHENTEWHNIVAWRNSADIVEKFVRKGTQLYVEGKLSTRSYQDQNGGTRYTTEIIADNIQLLGRKSDNPAMQGGVSAPAQTDGAKQGGYQQGGYQQPSASQQPVSTPAPADTKPVDTDDDPQDDLPF